MSKGVRNLALMFFALLAVLCVWAAMNPSEERAASAPAGTTTAGTATEQTLCADLEAGASTETLYRDATAVNNDVSTGPDDLSLEALAFVNAVDGLPGAASIQAEVERLKGDC